jgi:hypothetical protein
MERSSGALRYVYAALYAAAALVGIDQAAELAASLVPFRIGEVQWRFGAYGLVIGRVTTLVLVDGMVLLAAAGRGHAGVLRAWGVLHFLLAALIVPGLFLFALDALELRRAVRPEAELTLLVASARAAAVAAAAAVYAIVVGVVAFRAARPLGAGAGAASKPVLLVGGQGG